MPRHHKDWLKVYTSQYTAASESPSNYHLWTGIWTIAGALRRRVKVNELIYEVTPNFYIILVGPAGVAKKSTTINLGSQLLEHVPDVKFGQNSGSWQGLGVDLSESEIWFKLNPEDESEKPQAMSAVSVAASELGTFLRPDDNHALSFLTDVWDGKIHTYRHKTRTSGGMEIKNPWLNLIGATTPAWIQNNVPEVIIGEGLTSRIVFVYEDVKRRSVARPSKEIRGSDFHKLRDSLIEDLIMIGTMAGDYEYSFAADDWMEAWYKKYDSEIPAHLASERFSGYLQRKQTHIIKLAMIRAASKRNELVLEREDFEEAEQILEITEKSMLKVFNSIGQISEARYINELTTLVKAYKFITAEELYHHVHNTMARKDFEYALREAILGRRFKIETRDGVRGVTLGTAH